MPTPPPRPLTAAALVYACALVVLGTLHALDVALEGAALLWTPGLIALLAAPLLGKLALPGASCEAGDEEINTLSITDPLTQAMNRRGITMGLLEAMAQAERYNTPLSLARVRIDDFSHLEATHGQALAHKALTEVAGVLTETLRMPDKVGRYEDDEFMVVLPHTAPAPARQIAERLRVGVQKSKLSLPGERRALSLSIGIAHYVKGQDLESLLSRAQAALEQAVGGGGNRVQVDKRNASRA